MKYVFEILEEVDNAGSDERRLEILIEHKNNWGLRDILKGTFDDRVQWNLPIGKPPYQECEEHNAPSMLTRKNKDFKWLAKGYKPGEALPGYKREAILLGILESIHGEDAKVVCGMIEKKLPYKNVTKDLAVKAFPDLFPQ